MSRSERSESSLREEIADLSDYLEGVPEELKAGGAFDGYEARLRDLQQGQDLAENEELVWHVPMVKTSTAR